jgi:hypothetical protein
LSHSASFHSRENNAPSNAGTKQLGNGSGGGRSSDENILTGEVAEVMFVGEALECQVVVGDTRMRLKLHPATKVAPGQKIDLSIPVDRCRVLAE